ncbi:MAG: hypothetical protein HY898_06595 [Deltaproteobacteria bacterium]|nr:hypothetical protein [Deltaproteobacteria bacterium]
MRSYLAAIPAIVAGAVLVAAPRHVEGQGRPAPVSYGSYEMEVMVGGSARPEYQLGGQTYVEGRLGDRYTIRIANHDSRRVEVVVAVDGRDAIDGQPASPSKRGYVLPPYGSTEIDGFRLSMNDVAAFRFTTVPDSYASRMGTPWNVGQITASFFPERMIQRPRPMPPIARRSAPASESRGGARPERDGAQGLGTEFGERRWSPVHETSFVRADPISPSGRVTIRYNDRRGLCAIGIEALCEWRPRPRPYVAPYYPPYEPPRRFAPPPSGWQED